MEENFREYLVIEGCFYSVKLGGNLCIVGHAISFADKSQVSPCQRFPAIIIPNLVG